MKTNERACPKHDVTVEKKLSLSSCALHIERSKYKRKLELYWIVSVKVARIFQFFFQLFFLLNTHVILKT